MRKRKQASRVTRRYKSADKHRYKVATVGYVTNYRYVAHSVDDREASRYECHLNHHLNLFCIGEGGDGELDTDAQSDTSSEFRKAGRMTKMITAKRLTHEEGIRWTVKRTIFPKWLIEHVNAQFPDMSLLPTADATK